MQYGHSEWVHVVELDFSYMADKLGHVGYDYSESNHPRWETLEESLVSSANNGIIPITHRPSIQCFTNKTDNRFNPVAYVGGKFIPVLVILLVGEKILTEGTSR